MINDKPSSVGYFVAIICVVGGVLLFPSPMLFLMYICPLLLLILTPILLMYIVRHWEERKHI